MGIIPARAGFTRRRVTLTGDFRDHPRSRGVYVTHTMFRLPETGSSPLARGLRPGYAGGDPGLLGSSPLARGLPGGLLPSGRARGIIPARAGFTAMTWASRAARRDHPRSRGVYYVLWADALAREGSSPLARGLPKGYPAPIIIPRIIPARAGFTRRPRGWWPGGGDHPRSRGVYIRPSARLASRAGSSPLARGLRPGNVQGPCGRRIIPARAGFTPPILVTRAPGWDHPRSRGVYAILCGECSAYLGSSPLARGLL